MSNEIRDGFSRQRRNFLIITTAIFISYYWDVDFETINFLGNEIILNQGNNVYHVLWALFVYWAWRYRHYLRELGGLDFTNTFAKARYRSMYKWLVVQSNKEQFWNGIDAFTPNGESGGLGENEELVFGFADDNFFQRQLNMTIQGDFDVVAERGDTVSFAYKVGWRRLMAANINACLHILNNTRLFSEYVLPPLLALSFVIYWACFHLFS